MKIEKHADAQGYVVGVKRCYLPYTLTSCCPKCKAETRLDLSDQYLSFPKLEEPMKVHFMCTECDHEWDEQVLLKFEMVPVPPTPSEVIGETVYLDRGQCAFFELKYVPAGTELTVAADALLKSKAQGYDKEYTALLKALGQRTLSLRGTGHGWFEIKGVR